MDDRKPTDGQKSGPGPEPTDAELSGRLRGLDSALNRVRAERKSEQASPPPDPSSTSAGLTLAFRLGSEFVAGVLVGAGLGWGIDYVFGTSPWGLIVFLLLGFGASIMNMMRAAGETGRRKPPPGGK